MFVEKWKTAIKIDVPFEGASDHVVSVLGKDPYEKILEYGSNDQ